MKIGRYKIAFGRNSFGHIAANWIPHPFRVWHFLCFWFIKEARPNDVDRKQQYPTNTLMEYEGRRYYYWKAPRDVAKGKVVFGETRLEERANRKEKNDDRRITSYSPAASKFLLESPF